MATRFLLIWMLAACGCAAPASAEDGAGAPLDYRVGNAFRSPFNPNDFHRNLFALTHPNGYTYGSSYFNLSSQAVPSLRGRDPDETQQMLSASWAVPVSARWAFEGYASVLASRSFDDPRGEAGADSSLAMQLMFDASAAMGYRKNSFRIGIEYQYWNSKSGNPWINSPASPMLRAEYHFR